MHMMVYYIIRLCVLVMLGGVGGEGGGVVLFLCWDVNCMCRQCYCDCLLVQCVLCTRYRGASLYYVCVCACVCLFACLVSVLDL